MKTLFLAENGNLGSGYRIATKGGVKQDYGCVPIDKSLTLGYSTLRSRESDPLAGVVGNIVSCHPG
jgi:hypothetical protein